ncbi:hypothetical protein C5167_035377 [Papaver somniferum]|uniref:Uncharacterized protein n=1 Tax=Papaver somniferum TaxID=3469 RepID=A0A4Y7KH75_PAPSO|nr:hypothetical protein C5167_035377 [Papaver somniferum]
MKTLKRSCKADRSALYANKVVGSRKMKKRGGLLPTAPWTQCTLYRLRILGLHQRYIQMGKEVGYVPSMSKNDRKGEVVRCLDWATKRFAHLYIYMYVTLFCYLSISFFLFSPAVLSHPFPLVNEKLDLPRLSKNANDVALKYTSFFDKHTDYVMLCFPIVSGKLRLVCNVEVSFNDIVNSRCHEKKSFVKSFAIFCDKMFGLVVL